MNTTLLAITEAARHGNMSTAKTADVLSAFLCRLSTQQDTAYERDILISYARDIAAIGGQQVSW